MPDGLEPPKADSCERLRELADIEPWMNRSAGAVIAIVAILAVSSFVFLAAYQGRLAPTGGSHSATSNSSTLTSGCGSRDQTVADWTTYHGNNSRVGDSPVDIACAKSEWKSQRLDGAIYAEPLVYHGTVVVATENDSVYALNATSGGLVWRTNVGTPMNGSKLPCGDFNPSGVTGTPVIDASSGIVYAVAFETPGQHMLVALDLSDGKIRFTVSADPPGADPLVHQERGALALANGKVYIPYGGLAGDCGDYHGWVVGVNEDGSGSLVSYEVPTQREEGIWAPSGVAVALSGEVFITAGNGASSTTFDHGNAVIGLSPSLQQLSYFAPSDWSALNQGDTDLGSAGPLLIRHGEIFQIGKEGVGYILNATRLGGSAVRSTLERYALRRSGGRRQPGT